MIALLIPVKDFHKAKSRLSALLSDPQRAELARAMFEDVAESVNKSPAVVAGTEVTVVLLSSCRQAIEHATAIGWEILHEESQTSESASVDQASALLDRRGYRGVLRLPADIPLVSADDVEELLKMSVHGSQNLIVPSHEGTGTNALLRCPPALFPSRFGPNSLALHLEEARNAGASIHIAHFPRIALDVDAPADLALVLKQDQDIRTVRLLKNWKIQERINAFEGC
jgi:2-phospho-L-lactate/phosphoenolpyruvate guanylyltransferase